MALSPETTGERFDKPGGWADYDRLYVHGHKWDEYNEYMYGQQPPPRTWRTTEEIRAGINNHNVPLAAATEIPTENKDPHLGSTAISVEVSDTLTQKPDAVGEIASVEPSLPPSDVDSNKLQSETAGSIPLSSDPVVPSTQGNTASKVTTEVRIVPKWYQDRVDEIRAELNANRKASQGDNQEVSSNDNPALGRDQVTNDDQTSGIDVPLTESHDPLPGVNDNKVVAVQAHDTNLISEPLPSVNSEVADTGTGETEQVITAEQDNNTKNVISTDHADSSVVDTKVTQSLRKPKSTAEGKKPKTKQRVLVEA